MAITRLVHVEELETEEQWSRELKREQALDSAGFTSRDEYVPIWLGDMEDAIQPNKGGPGEDGRQYKYEPRISAANRTLVMHDHGDYVTYGAAPLALVESAEKAEVIDEARLDRDGVVPRPRPRWRR